MQELALMHRHENGATEQLVAADEQQVDHLRVVRYRCSCGEAPVVLTRIPEAARGRTWPAAILKLVE
jgi:hypothetical protein